MSNEGLLDDLEYLDHKPDELEPAGFIKRVIATVIDFIMIYALIIIFSLALLSIIGNHASADLFVFWISLLSLLVSAYFPVMESSKYQGTFGKYWLNIKVVDEEGKRLKFAKAVGRFFLKIFSYSFFFIGFLIVLFTKKKQAAHDLIINTHVVVR